MSTWLQEGKGQLAQVEVVRLMVQKKMGHIAYIKSELERLRQRAALAALEIHSGLKPLADPEIEGCSGLRNRRRTLIHKSMASLMRPSKKLRSWALLSRQRRR